jgi:asparagine synthase (glutamine-hydrolysing)
MGSLASNHFLGFRDTLRSLGVGSLLTGCYWDYLFKGLGYNKQVNRWTTMESAGPFGFAYYARHAASATPLAAAVRERLEADFPPALRTSRSEASLQEIEHRRIFPLFYEEDSTARSVPQRVLPWYIPVADNAVMDARLKLSTSMKLNRRAMIEVSRRLCGPRIAGIPDANTGAPIGAPLWREVMSYQARRVRSRLARMRPTRATTGSWLNWGYYIGHSQPLRELWEKPNPQADALFDAIVGEGRWNRDLRAYSGSGVNLLLRLLTLKIWLDQRS